MARGPLSIYDDIDVGDDSTIPAVGATLLTIIIFAISASLKPSSETKLIAQVRENNFGMDGEEIHKCTGIARPSENNDQSSALIAHHGEEQTLE